ncbi:membrane protein [Streptomyces phage Gilgamesh]|uniref:Membrane protein n=1 Tax=Streptomyces phage Gilgamesh TaxID=2599890 RepID=A0A5J6TRA0_9CAUD|nr:membrane protein [Streptomyces phage Gilgamesh]QFG13336.1 membrane protein [Streptomyces phage Gilgamesh]
MEGHAVKINPDDRKSRLIVSFAVGCIVLGLVLLVALLVDDTHDDDSGHGTGRCAPAVAGTVDPVTCLPYGSTGMPGTNNSGNSAQRPKAPAAKAPAAPKPPAAAPKVPAAPPRVSLGKR